MDDTDSEQAKLSLRRPVVLPMEYNQSQPQPQSQPEMWNPSEPNAGGDVSSDAGMEDFDPAVVLISQKSVSGMLENMIARTMLKQCDNQVAPALDFYNCVENTTNLPQLWMAMGLNATLLRIRTVALTTFRGSNVTQKKDVYITVADVNPDDDIVSLQDLLRLVAAQTPNFCQSAESLMNCLDPYLATCFPESPSGDSDAMNQFDDQDQSVRVPAPQGPQPPTNSDAKINQTEAVEDTNDDDEFLGIPMMYTQKQITYFMRQTLGLLCANQAMVFKDFIGSVPCLMSTIGQQNCKRFDDVIVNVRDLMEANNATGPNPDLCGAMRDSAECHLDLAFENCGQGIASLGQAIYQFYFESVNCMESAGSNNVVNVRQPFNQMIL